MLARRECRLTIRCNGRVKLSRPLHSQGPRQLATPLIRGVRWQGNGIRKFQSHWERGLRNLVAILSAAAVVGCAAQHSVGDGNITAPRGITLQVARADPEGLSFVLNNRSNRPFQYLHWTGRGTRPVLSIETMVDGKIERHDEWPVGSDGLLVTHEELLFPGERVEFSVPGDALHRVGVMYWDDDSKSLERTVMYKVPETKRRRAAAQLRRYPAQCWRIGAPAWRWMRKMQTIRRDRAPLVLLLLAIGHSGFAQDAGTNRNLRCSPPSGAESLWKLADLNFLVIGELHGTRETPRVFGELVCSATTEAKKRVLVALEFPETARAAFEAYVASKGTDEDRSKFLVESGVMARSQFPDGRTSEAMLRMVERLRMLRGAGRQVFVTTFQRPISTPSESQTPYEIDLADSLRKAFDSGNYDLAMVLVGNAHARRVTVTPGGGQLPFDPMATHLPSESTLTLNAVTGAGEAWNCQSTGCGVHRRESQSMGGTSSIVLDDKLLPGYDGVIGIGPITASLPALGN